MTQVDRRPHLFPRRTERYQPYGEEDELAQQVMHEVTTGLVQAKAQRAALGVCAWILTTHSIDRHAMDGGKTAISVFYGFSPRSLGLPRAA